MKQYDIAIIGGGIGGLCAALALQQKGFKVTVYESAKEIKPLGAGLGIGSNALRSLIGLGVGEEILGYGNVLNKLTIQSYLGRIINQVDFATMSQEIGVENVTIHRADLHAVLLNNLREGTVQLNKRCVDFTQDSQGVTLYFEDGESRRPNLVIAADGIHSLFRKKLFSNFAERYAGYTCWRSVVPFQDDAVQVDVSTETWGPQGRFGIVPLAGNQVYWFACINSLRNDETKTNYKVEDLLEVFKDYPHPIPQMIQLATDDQLVHDDILDIKPLSSFVSGHIALIGDAAHATTPNMGQGAGQAIEDALVLANCFERNDDSSAAFQAYENKRVQRARKVIKMSRKIGSASQWEHPLSMALRNTLFQLVPSPVITQRLKFLYDIDLS